MKAEFTTFDKRLLHSFQIAPEAMPMMNREEQAALIRQLRMDLEASERELATYRHQDRTHDAMIQAYERLDVECCEVRRELRTVKRAKRLWRASACVLVSAALFWGGVVPWLVRVVSAWRNG